MKAATPKKTAGLVRRQMRIAPALGIVLGSGFHGVADELHVDVKISYKDLPGFPSAGVSGHSGEMLVGSLGGTPVALFSGRSHYYEGPAMEAITFGVRVLAALGVKDLLLTNAAGGINSRFRPGDLMIIRDHINLMGMNPLRGPAAEGLPRFVDMTQAYSPRLNRLLERASRQVPVRLKEGVYLAVSGPSYETPAEIRAFARLGADAVGMSTAPETIVARQCGMNVAGLSCITNLAAGRGKEPLSHAEVLETGKRVQVTATKLMVNFARLYAQAR